MTSPTSPTAAEALLRSLKRQGVDYLFSNLGSDHPPFLEALARARERGDLEAFPEVVLCPHEFAAVSAAHGYTVATGKPQGVLVHVDVGTLNAGAAMHNAHRANVPMVVLAGLAPLTERGYPGSRDSSVHYLQDVPDQIEIVEQYCRWTTEYRIPADPDATVRRGLERATGTPEGPVYIAAAREALEATDYATAGRDRAGESETTPPAAGDRTLERLSTELERADRPVLITTHLGKRPESVPAVVKFAEATGTGVIEQRPTSLCFPRDHDLHLGYDPTAVFDEADLLVVARSDFPWIPSKGTPSDDTRVVHIDPDPTKPDFPLRDFRADLTVTASPEEVLPTLAERVAPDVGSDAHAHWTDVSARRRRENERRLAEDRDEGRLTPAVLSDALNAVVDESTIVVDDAVTSKSSVLNYLDLTEPGSYHMKGGSALGWAPGAAVGVKMAHPEKRVIDVTGDGAYVFSNPTASAWLAANRGTPTLTVVYNNAGWNAVKNATLSQHPEGHAAGDRVPESQFDPEMDLSIPARSVDAHTERVTDPNELERALSDALDALSEGTPALLDVRIESV